jgi:hypothetical protein
VNPLIQNGRKLIPSVTRVFSRARPMSVYVQAYQQDALPAQPLVGYVSFYRGKTKIFETAPAEVTGAASNRLRTMPVQFTIPLDSLSPGGYECQVTLLNPASQKAAFWRTAIVVAP